MIRFIKFTNGEEVVADLTEVGQEYALKQPVRFVIGRSGELGGMPYSPLTKGDVIKVNKSHVMFIAELEDEIYNAYNGQFGSGIVTPPSGLII